MKRFQKTRFAPTPSGFLHIGNVYSFLVTAALAQRHGADILLRIDDMDRERYRPEYVDDVFKTLEFMELHYTSGPKNIDDFDKHWSQLHRLSLYNNALEQLKNSGLVFACDCSRTKILQQNAHGYYEGVCLHKGIPLDTPGVSWRLNTQGVNDVLVNTTEQGVVKTQLPESVRFFMVRKKDGHPAYQLTSLIDDVHFGVDLIVRGLDLWDSTCAQLALANVLNFNVFKSAVFHHHALLTDTHQMKLSKSAGATSIKHMREQGMRKEEVLAMIEKMGGSTSFFSGNQ